MGAIKDLGNEGQEVSFLLATMNRVTKSWGLINGD